MRSLREITRARRSAEWLEIEALRVAPACPGIVGGSPAIKAVATAIERFAPHKGTVLLTGESGTGKELVVRALHQKGPFADGPLVSFNCSNLVNGLAESQLFGHSRGAFTHAHEAAPGCFRQAHHGTLLLDEIGELPPVMQAKLLRVAESLEVQPVGSTETVRVNLRLLAATNRNLRAMVKEGTFRADLYYRLEVASIKLPALRERLYDIAPLTAHFVDRYNHIFGKRIRLISRRCLHLLQAHRWPGNVRELAHVIERATLLGDDERIDLDDLPMELVETVSAAAPLADVSAPFGGIAAPLKSLDHVVRATVEEALRQVGGDCGKAARILRISRPAIYRKMVRLGISSASVRRHRGVGQTVLTRVVKGPGRDTSEAAPSAAVPSCGHPRSDQ